MTEKINEPELPAQETQPEENIEIPNNLKQLYEEVEKLVGHRVQLNLRTMVHKVVEGVVKKIDVTNNQDDLVFVIETSKGEERHTVMHGCQGWADKGLAEDLEKIEKVEAGTPSDIKSIEDAEIYLNKIEKGEYAHGYDEEYPDLDYLAKQLKKAIEDGIFTWEDLGKAVHWGKDEKSFDNHINYLRGYSVEK